MIFFNVSVSGKVRSGSEIVNEAKIYWNDEREYLEGEPPNKEEIYGGGGVFDLGARWTGKFDCSGLVSLCAGLRRHYYVKDGSLQEFLDQISREDRQIGDIVKNSDHAMIYEKDTLEGCILIRASSTAGKVSRGYISWDYLNTNGYSFYRFNQEEEPPTFKISGVEEGGIYSNPVTVEYIATDKVEGVTYAFGRYHGEKFRTPKKFTTPGEYSLYFYTADWAKNIIDTTIHFKIIGPPQVVSTSPRKNEEDVDIYKEIEIIFSQKMNPSSFEGGIEIKNKVIDSGVVILEKKWENNFTELILKVYDPVVKDDTVGLQFKTTYEVKILGTVSDSAGRTLDGNKKDV
jgi:hypothetical protein